MDQLHFLLRILPLVLPDILVDCPRFLGEVPRICGVSLQRCRTCAVLDTYIVYSVAWGAILACHAACRNYAGFMVARFLLGIMESSVAPGFSFLTGKFYRREEQPLRSVSLTSKSYSTCIQLMSFIDMVSGIWYVLVLLLS